jgi:DNA-binding response OmpR family regulator
VARILLVEDDAETARLMRALLVADGHEVRVVGEGQAGIEAAVAEPADVLLLDFELPDSKGPTVCGAVREREQTDHRTTIVMLTSRADTASKLLAFSAGADDYLVKPVDASELRARIGRWLESRQLQAELVVQRRLQAIREIVATICHEVNNPLSVAMMGIDLVLAQGQADANGARELRIAREHLDRIDAVVRSLRRAGDRTVSYIGDDRMIDLERRE